MALGAAAGALHRPRPEARHACAAPDADRLLDADGQQHDQLARQEEAAPGRAVGWADVVDPGVGVATFARGDIGDRGRSGRAGIQLAVGTSLVTSQWPLVDPLPRNRPVSLRGVLKTRFGAFFFEARRRRLIAGVSGVSYKPARPVRQTG